MRRERNTLEGDGQKETKHEGEGKKRKLLLSKSIVLSITSVQLSFGKRLLKQRRHKWESKWGGEEVGGWTQ